MNEVNLLPVWAYNFIFTCINGKDEIERLAPNASYKSTKKKDLTLKTTVFPNIVTSLTFFLVDV